MAYPADRRDELRAAYVYRRMDLKAAAAAVSVPYQTAQRWKKQALVSGDCWNQARNAARLADDGALGELTFRVVEGFAALFEATIEQLQKEARSEDVGDALKRADALSKLSDAYIKTMSAASRADPTVDRLSIGIEVLDLLRRFIGDDFPEYREAFAKVLKPFGTHLSKHLAKQKRR